MIRGAYHFALPNLHRRQPGQLLRRPRRRVVRDGKTLPGALDIEYNPYGATCYGKTQAGMVSWIRDFRNTYKSRTGRDAVDLHHQRLVEPLHGQHRAFGSPTRSGSPATPSTVGTLPGAWPFYTIWQWTSSPLDQNHFNGDYSRLQALANG